MNVTACDTGGATAPSEDTLDAAVTLLVDRNDIALELLGADAPASITRCAADHLAADPTFVALYDTDGEFTKSQEDQFSELLTGAVGACRS